MNKKGTVIIITIIIIIAVIGITLGAIISNRSSISYLNISNVKSSVLGDDGNYHVISADVSIEVPRKYLSSLDSEVIKALVSDAFENLDYERLSERDDIKYIENEVENKLADYFTEHKIENFYVTNFFDGDLNPEPIPTESKRNKAMKGLFKGIK